MAEGATNRQTLISLAWRPLPQPDGAGCLLPAPPAQWNAFAVLFHRGEML